MKILSFVILLILSNISMADLRCSQKEGKLVGVYKEPVAKPFTKKDTECKEVGLDQLEKEYAGHASITDKVDLNGDGQCEYFLYDMHGSGSGGGLYWIYTYINGKKISLGDYQTWEILQVGKKNGWYQLHSYDYSGNIYYFFIHTFNGEKYESKGEKFYCNETAGKWQRNNPS